MVTLILWALDTGRWTDTSSKCLTFLFCNQNGIWTLFWPSQITQATFINKHCSFSKQYHRMIRLWQLLLHLLQLTSPTSSSDKKLHYIFKHLGFLSLCHISFWNALHWFLLQYSSGAYVLSLCILGWNTAPVPVANYNSLSNGQCSNHYPLGKKSSTTPDSGTNSDQQSMSYTKSMDWSGRPDLYAPGQERPGKAKYCFRVKLGQ